LLMTLPSTTVPFSGPVVHAASDAATNAMDE
jgi:hypothetical protein